jgi:16S rRNA (uracil1498-N3)-methyltransferase
MHRSYVSPAWVDSFLIDNNEPLPIDAAKRFTQVLRIHADEEIAVFDGQGRELRGYLKLNDNNVYFSKAKLHQQALSQPQLILYQAAISEDKISETIKRGCEFGVDRFIIFNAERSEAHCYLKLTRKKDRFNRIAIDACRQSGRFFIPPVYFSPSLLFDKTPQGFGIYGDVAEKRRLSEILKPEAGLLDEFHIVVGPEGGLSPKEIEVLQKWGFWSVSWAPYVLRSELAHLAPLAIINAFCGRA